MIFCTLFVVSMIIWIFFVKMFHDLKMTAFKFYFGSIGLFFILLFFFRTYLEQGFKILLFYSLLFLSNLTHIFYLKNLFIFPRKYINIFNKYFEIFYCNFINKIIFHLFLSNWFWCYRKTYIFRFSYNVVLFYIH